MGDLFCFRCVPKWIWALGVVAFCGTAWVGALITPRPVSVVKTAPPGQATDPSITFLAYDTQGKRLDRAVLTGPYPRQPLDGSNKTEPLGTKRTVTAEYKGQQVSQQVVWLAPSDYRAWLSKPAGLKQLLADRDPNFNPRAVDTIATHIANNVADRKYAYEYPIVFKASP